MILHNIIRKGLPFVAVIGIAFAADAAEIETINGNACQNVYSPETTLGQGLIHNTTSVTNIASGTRYVQCPVHRILPLSTAGWSPSVVAYDTTHFLSCNACSMDQYGNIMQCKYGAMQSGDVRQQILLPGSGGELLVRICDHRMWSAAAIAASERHLPGELIVGDHLTGKHWLAVSAVVVLGLAGVLVSWNHRSGRPDEGAARAQELNELEAKMARLQGKMAALEARASAPAPAQPGAAGAATNQPAPAQNQNLPPRRPPTQEEQTARFEGYFDNLDALRGKREDGPLTEAVRRFARGCEV